MTQAEFARHRGVSRKTVTVWKRDGYLTFGDDGRIQVAATEAALAAAGKGNGSKGGNAEPVTRLKPVTSPARTLAADEATEALGALIEQYGDLLSTAEAERVKENYLARLRKLEFETKAGVLVDRAAAEKLLFEAAREIRDAWLAWPARVAVPMAARLNVEARQLAEILSEYVHQQLAEIGEVDADLSGAVV